MKDKKRTEILLKFIKKVYNENPDLQKLIDVSMVEVCAEEGVSNEQVFFLLLFFIVMSYPNKRVEEINVLCLQEITYENSRVCFKNKWNFSDNQEKSHAEFLWLLQGFPNFLALICLDFSRVK